MDAMDAVKRAYYLWRERFVDIAIISLEGWLIRMVLAFLMIALVFLLFIFLALLLVFMPGEGAGEVMLLAILATLIISVPLLSLFLIFIVSLVSGGEAICIRSLLTGRSHDFGGVLRSGWANRGRLFGMMFMISVIIVIVTLPITMVMVFLSVIPFIGFILYMMAMMFLSLLIAMIRPMVLFHFVVFSHEGGTVMGTMKRTIGMIMDAPGGFALFGLLSFAAQMVAGFIPLIGYLIVGIFLDTALLSCLHMAYMEVYHRG